MISIFRFLTISRGFEDQDAWLIVDAGGVLLDVVDDEVLKQKSCIL